jgi:hypothetical protein
MDDNLGISLRDLDDDEEIFFQREGGINERQLQLNSPAFLKPTFIVSPPAVFPGLKPRSGAPHAGARSVIQY